MYSPANKTSAHVRCLTMTVLIVATAGCEVERPNFEYVYLPGTEIDSGANLPFTPAIKVRDGSIVFLSGITGAPVPHSHPHIPAEFAAMPDDMEGQARATLENLRKLSVRHARLELVEGKDPATKFFFKRMN